MTEPACQLPQSDPPAALPPDDGPQTATEHHITAPGAEAFHTILTAIILAFVFRAFFIEAFIIPTGSMAESLMGVHGQIVCPDCGWEFPFGPAVYAREDRFIPPSAVKCPNCHYLITEPSGPAIRRDGDRIVVQKWPYLFSGPFRLRRWDVIVFRDPADTTQNYIKRAVGLPGETIEVLDGDVYVSSTPGGPLHIARKTAAAQRALWYVVFDQDHVPRRCGGVTHSRPWVPEQPVRERGWLGLATRVLHYQPVAQDKPQSLRFAPGWSPDYLRDLCGYDTNSANNLVRDLRIRAEITPGAASLPDQPVFGLRMRCDDTLFDASFSIDGVVTLTMDAAGRARETIGRARVASWHTGDPVEVELRQVDYRASVWVDGRQILVTSDAQYHPPRVPVHRTTPCDVWMVGYAAPLSLRHVRIDRDVYYTHSYRSQRADEGRPFHLGPNEVFVLGDNSPSSHDSREWTRTGAHLRDRQPPYRPGTVPTDQIVGRAFFVYLPGLLPVGRDGTWRVPDLGRVRFVR